MDFHVRLKWEPRTVVVFDVSHVLTDLLKPADNLENRLVNHSGLLDWVKVCISGTKNMYES